MYRTWPLHGSPDGPTHTPPRPITIVTVDMPLRNISISSPPQARNFYDFNVSLPFLACFHLVDTYKNPPQKNTIVANILSFLTRIFSFSFKMTSIFLFIFLFKMTGIFSLFFSGLPNQSASRCRIKTNKRMP